MTYVKSSCSDEVVVVFRELKGMYSTINCWKTLSEKEIGLGMLLSEKVFGFSKNLLMRTVHMPMSHIESKYFVRLI